MTGLNQASTETWPVRRAMVLGATCLVIGLVSGWLIAGVNGAALSPSPSGAAPPPLQQAATPSATADPAKLLQEADSQAAPLLEVLKADPNNTAILTKLGNLYYDAKQYPAAVNWYTRVLAVQPSDADVRTDLGTAYWYMGNADSAIAEFTTALGYHPNNPNTLFNRGLVKWQGKHDGPAALADWKQLLASNPNYEGRGAVQQMMAEINSQSPAR
jgi:tetratricopeptide (TPR) repeat protein